MSKTVIVPGSYDPVTLGHYRLVCEAARLFDRVVVALVDNVGKHYLFSAEERGQLCSEVFSSLENVAVSRFECPLFEVCESVGADAIVKGVRNCIDFEYEYDYFVGNRILTGGIHTIFIPSEPSLRHVSSSAVRELLKIGASLSGFVPDGFEDRICALYAQRSSGH